MASEPIPEWFTDTLERCRTTPAAHCQNDWHKMIEWLTPHLMTIARREYHKSYPTNPGAPEPHDLVQEALVAFYRSIQSFNNSHYLFGWLTAIIKNRLRDAWRKRHTYFTPTEFYDGAVEDTVPIVEDSSVSGLALIQAMNRLTLAHREIVFCVYWRDMSVPQAARVLDIPIGTAKSRLHHALRGLKRTVVPL